MMYKKYAEPWTSLGGQGQDNTIAAEWGPGGSIDLLLSVDPSTGPFTFKQRLSVAIAIQKTGDALSNIRITSDRQIILEHTGLKPTSNVHRQKMNLSIKVTHYNINGQKYIDSSFLRNGNFHYYLKHGSEVDSFDFSHHRYIKIK